VELGDAVNNFAIGFLGLLLEKGAAVDAEDTYRRTALHYAASGGDEAVVQLLLEKGAAVDAVDAVDGRRRTVLHKAVKNNYKAVKKNHKAVVRLLFERGGKS
jgi:ankyrin repeat protein